MVSDQEPRYRLVDDDGNIVGSLYGKPDGSVAIQETDSGADREVALAPDGTFSAPSVETESVSTEELSTELEEPDDISENRDFGTTYQNTEGHDIIWVVRMRTDGGTDDKVHGYGLRVGNTSSLSSDHELSTNLARSEHLDDTTRFVYSVRVPDGYYFELLEDGANEAQIEQWHERGMTA